MGPRVTITRLMACLGATVACTGLAIQLYVLMIGPLGPIAGMWRFLAFFTVLTNMLAAVLFIVAIFRPRFSAAGASLQTAATAYMTFLGAVYVLLLRELWNPQGLGLIADGLLHYATPAITLAFWVACVPKTALRWRDTLRWTGYPLCYLGYALIRAQFDGFYPYHFIDAGKLGLRGALWNGATMFGAFAILAAVFVAIGKMTGRRRTVAGPAQSAPRASSSQ